MRIHRVYCKSVSESYKKFSLDEAESHHLVKALRLKEGSHVEVFDGNGKQALCLIVEHSNKKCELERISEIEDQSIPSRSLNAVIPFIKKNNFNYMIQKLTEIGVNKFMIYKPDLSDQSIAKKDFEKIISKSKEIIINVCKQCGNNFLPNIEYYSNLENAIKEIQEDHDKYIFDTDATEYFLQDELDNDSSVTIITGPESGFSNKEIKIIANGELKIRYLGRNILRSETAPIVVSSIIKNHFGRI